MKDTVAIITNIAGYSKASSLGDYSWLLARKLKENGYKVYYYCKADYLTDEDKDSEIELRVYPSNFWGNIYKSLNREGVKICVFQYLPSVWGIKGLPIKTVFNVIILRLSGKRVITFFHEICVRWTFKKLILFVQAIMQRVGGATIAFSSNRVITSIDRYHHQLSAFNRATSIIPIGSNILVQDISSAELQTVRNKYADDDEVLIGSFGNRDHSKLIRLVDILLKKGLKVKLLLIGNIRGDALNNMQSLIKALNLDDKVIFTGGLANKDVYAHLKMLDLYVLLEDVFGKGRGGATFKSGSLAAAFSAGQVIIGSKGDMNDANFLNGKVPIVLLGDNEEENALVFEELIKDKDKRDTLKKDTEKYYRENLSWDVLTKKYIEVIKSVS